MFHFPFLKYYGKLDLQAYNYIGFLKSIFQGFISGNAIFCNICDCAMTNISLSSAGNFFNQNVKLWGWLFSTRSYIFICFLGFFFYALYFFFPLLFKDIFYALVFFILLLLFLFIYYFFYSSIFLMWIWSMWALYNGTGRDQK